MPQETDRVGVVLLCGVLIAFIAAVVVGISYAEPGRAFGGLLLVVGLVVIAFARRLAVAQQALSEKPYLPSHWKNVRPLTFILWGAGVAIMGLLQLLGF